MEKMMLVVELKGNKYLNPLEKMHPFSIAAKTYPCSINSDFNEEKELIYKAANFLNEKMKSYHFNHIKNSHIENETQKIF